MTALIRRHARLFYFLISFCIACGLSLIPPASAASAGAPDAGWGLPIRANAEPAPPPPGPATTQIADVVYRADGSPAHGVLMITWPAFTTASGFAVAAGSMNVTLGPNGALSLSLIPNEGATPAGTFYKILLKLDDGSQNTEFWVVPLHSPATVAQIRSTVMPATVAAQFASRQYVDAAIAAATGNGGNNQNSLEGVLFADKFSSIQAAITAAGTTEAVLIPPTYTAADTFTNPNNIPILDMRGGASGAREAFDVRQYGAIPNNTFDSQPAIQAAVNAASAATGLAHGGQQQQSVFCPDSGPDSYFISKPIVIHQSWIKFGGDARGACPIFAVFHGPMFALGPLDTRYTAFPVSSTRSIVSGGNSYPISSTGDGNRNPYWMELDESQNVNLNGLAGFTIDFWFFLTAAPGDNSEFFGGLGMADNDSASNLTADAFFSGGALLGRLEVNGALKQVAIGAPSINAWHHFAMTWDGANLRGFLDGNLNGTTAAPGAITWPVRSSLLFGAGNPILWPDGGGANPSPDGSLDALRISSTARWTAAFTPVQSKPTADAATLLLCNFDNQYDIFTGCSSGDGKISWLPIHRSTGGTSMISNVTLENISLNGKGVADGIWIYGVTDSKFASIVSAFSRRNLTFWGGGTFQNRIYDVYLGIGGGGGGSQWCIAGLEGALGVTTFFKPHCITNAAFPFYWQGGSSVWIHPETTPNQGVITSFYFDGAGAPNTTVTMMDGGADTEVPNTAFSSDLTLRNVQAFSMMGGNLGAGLSPQAPVRVLGGGAIKFSGTNFVLHPASPSAVKIVANPAQPVVLDNAIQQGGTNVPWCDAAGQCAALNSSITSTANLAWSVNRFGRALFAGVDLSGLGDLLTARAGNSSTAATASGATTAGNCARWDSNGNLVDSGGACGGSSTPGGSSGQLQFNNAGAFGGFTLSGDCTLTPPSIICTKTGGVAFAASATTDATNAANISSGTLLAARLPALTGDVTAGAGSAATALANIPNDVPMAGDILAANTAAPASPGAGKTRIYVDSSSKVLSSKNDSGSVTHTVATADCSSTGHVQKINADGSVTCSADAGGSLTINGYYLSNGSSNYIGYPLRAATPPLAANFTNINSPAITSAGNALLLKSPATAGTQLRMAVQNIGSSTTLTQDARVTITNQSTGLCGVLFRESSTGKVITMSWIGGGGNTLWPSVDFWSSATAYNSSLKSTAGFNAGEMFSTQLKYDGVNLTFYVSSDGINFVQYYQEAKNAHFTTAPDQWGFGCDAESATYDAFFLSLNFKAQ